MVGRNDDLSKMTVAASTLGWTVGEPWPDTFSTDFYTWTKDHATVAENGDVQCVEYTDGDGGWLIVYAE